MRMVGDRRVNGMVQYFTGPYYRNPIPYTTFDFGEPVPGWGVNVGVVGPNRLGVGQMSPVAQRIAAETRVAPIRALMPGAVSPQQEPDVPEIFAGPEADKTPSWLVPAVVAVVGLGTLGFVGTKKGWF